MKREECFIHNEDCKPLNKETGKAVIKEAHILSKSATMEHIHGPAKGGLKVYHVSQDQEVGWKKASAHFCFCGFHDDVVFKPIEDNNPFDPASRKQLFLHSLRSFAYTYHKKREEMDSKFQLYKDFKKAFSVFSNNIFSQEEQTQIKESYDSQMLPYEKVKLGLLQILKSESFSNMCYRVFTVNERYPFASAGCLMAELIDFNKGMNKAFFSENGAQLLQPAIMLTVFPDPHENATQIILACLGEDRNGLEYILKYDKLDKYQLAKAISSLILSANKDNSFFHPKLAHYLRETGEIEVIREIVQSPRGTDRIFDEIQKAPINLFDQKFSCRLQKINQ